MGRKRRTETTVVTETFWIFRRPRSAESGGGGSSRPAGWVRPEEAAALTGSSAGEIRRRVEAGRLDSTAAGGGEVLVRLDSMKTLETPQRGQALGPALAGALGRFLRFTFRRRS